MASEKYIRMLQMVDFETTYRYCSELFLAFHKLLNHSDLESGAPHVKLGYTDLGS
jgi:hypothetical protein